MLSSYVQVPGGAVLSPLRPPSLELRPSTSVWRQLHFSPPLPRVAPPPAMPAPRALLPTPHPLHQIGAVGVERKMAARTDAAFSVPSVEVEVTNLDPKVETDELEKILLALFQEHVPVSETPACHSSRLSAGQGEDGSRMQQTPSACTMQSTYNDHQKTPKFNVISDYRCIWTTNGAFIVYRLIVKTSTSLLSVVPEKE